MSADSVLHSRLAELSGLRGELHINGQPLTRLVERVGGTPFYVYDRSALSARVVQLRAALPSRVQLHYAIKANPMPAVIHHMRALVDGFDVASHLEMIAALDSGMPASEISMAGPAKQEGELRAAVAAGVTINCESSRELERIHKFGLALGVAPRVALRVNPDFELKGAGMKMAGSPRQFGIDAAHIPALLARMGELELHCEGLHIFCGSQNLKADAIIEANSLTVDLACGLAARSGRNFASINIGGGYGIPYFPNERTLDLEAVGAALGETLARHERALVETNIVVELGRFLVGEAGYYVSRVSDIKKSQGQVFVMTDGGLHQHLANSGNFGQVLRKNYPVLIGNRLGQPATTVANIVGPLCTPLDIVADRLPVPELEVGDLVVVLQSGAYGYTASPHLFLSHPAPKQILV